MRSRDLVTFLQQGAAVESCLASTPTENDEHHDKPLSTGTGALPAVGESVKFCGFDRPCLQNCTAKKLIITLTISNAYDMFPLAFLLVLVLPLRPPGYSQTMPCMSCTMHAMCNARHVHIKIL